MGQSLQLMIVAVKSILDTLGENDFVQIVKVNVFFIDNIQKSSSGIQGKEHTCKHLHYHNKVYSPLYPIKFKIQNFIVPLPLNLSCDHQYFGIIIVHGGSVFWFSSFTFTQEFTSPQTYNNVMNLCNIVTQQTSYPRNYVPMKPAKLHDHWPRLIEMIFHNFL